MAGTFVLLCGFGTQLNKLILLLHCTLFRKLMLSNGSIPVHELMLLIGLLLLRQLILLIMLMDLTGLPGSYKRSKLFRRAACIFCSASSCFFLRMDRPAFVTPATTMTNRRPPPTTSPAIRSEFASMRLAMVAVPLLTCLHVGPEKPSGQRHKRAFVAWSSVQVPPFVHMFGLSHLAPQYALGQRHLVVLEVALYTQDALFLHGFVSSHVAPQNVCGQRHLLHSEVASYRQVPPFLHWFMSLRSAPMCFGGQAQSLVV